MNNRMFSAINDIRYVQMQIEKLLDNDSFVKNQSSTFQKKDSKYNSINDSERFKTGLYSSRKNKQNDINSYHLQEISKSPKPKYKSSKSKSKSKYNSQSKSPKAKQNKKIKEEILNTIPIINQKQKKQTLFNSFNINNKQQAQQMPKLQLIKKQTELQNKIADNKNNQIGQQTQTRNIFLQWKKKDQQNNVNNNINSLKPKIEINQPNITKSAKSAEKTIQTINPKQISKPLGTRINQQIYKLSADDISSLQFTSKNKQKQQYSSTTSSIPSYLQQKNQIPLRTNEQYLIQKYRYKKNIKTQDLKNKYNLLDERINKLKTQFHCQIMKQQRSHFNKPISPKNRDYNLEQMSEKKRILNEYQRYSPLMKLIKINQKLKQQTDKNNQTKNISKSISPFKNVIKK